MTLWFPLRADVERVDLCPDVTVGMSFGDLSSLVSRHTTVVWILLVVAAVVLLVHPPFLACFLRPA